MLDEAIPTYALAVDYEGKAIEILGEVIGSFQAESKQLTVRRPIDGMLINYDTAVLRREFSKVWATLQLSSSAVTLSNKISPLRWKIKKIQLAAKLS